MKMFRLYLILTILVRVKNIICSNSGLNEIDEVKEEWVQESEFFELMEPINGQWRTDNGTNSSNLITDSDPTVDPLVVAIAAFVGAPVFLAAVVPPQLPTFPPQGAPGLVTGGGGVLPAALIIVIKHVNTRISERSFILAIKIHNQSIITSNLFHYDLGSGDWTANKSSLIRATRSHHFKCIFFLTSWNLSCAKDGRCYSNII